MAHAINLNAAAHYVEQPSVFARLRQSFADYREYLATYEELNALSGRQLAMGIELWPNLGDASWWGGVSWRVSKPARTSRRSDTP